MPIDTLLRRADLTNAVALELSSRNRLLPRRWDYAALALESAAVETWLRPQLRRGPSGKSASVVFADKGWRGARPLHVMTLEDRVLYRALLGLISEALPERLRSRVEVEQFRNAPLDVPGVEYISKTDVTSYYEFVDHDLLCAELIAQTGEELAVDALTDLLASGPRPSRRAAASASRQRCPGRHLHRPSSQASAAPGLRRVYLL